MSNKFPEEKYPVITNWPGTEGHSQGEHRCYHYSLTKKQVRYKADRAGEAATSTDISVAVFLDILGIAGIFVPAPIGVVLWATNLAAQINDASKKAMYLRLSNIWEKIGGHMGSFNYPRVTISQVLKLDYVNNKPTWIPEGFPRVPLEKYYLKH